MKNFKRFTLSSNHQSLTRYFIVALMTFASIGQMRGANSSLYAGDRLYFDCTNWLDANAKIKVNLYGTNGSYATYVWAEQWSGNIYYIDLTGTYNGFQVCRMNPDDLSEQWNYTSTRWADQRSDNDQNLLTLGSCSDGQTMTWGTRSYTLTKNKFIYFDNHVTGWTTPHVRLGKNSYCEAPAMTKVAGTSDLWSYKKTDSNWDGYHAFTISDGAGWTALNNVFTSNDVTNRTIYWYENVSDDITIIAGSKGGTVTNPSPSVDWYSATKSSGQMTYTVTVSASHCTVSLEKYTSDPDAATPTTTSLSSGGTVVPTQYIKVTVTPDACYEFGSVTVSNSGTKTAAAAGTPGVYYITGNATVTATCVQANLALNKTVVAGYEPGNTGEHSNKITDGTNDAWTTYSDQDASVEWFYVDLGAYYQLSSVDLVWGEVYSTDYLIQARQSAPANASEAADDTKWFTLAEETGATASATKSTSVSGPARYIRVHSLTRNGGFLRLHEMRVYGTGTSTAYTIPTLSTAEVNSYPAGYRTVKLHLVATDSKSTAIHTYRITDESDNVSVVTTDASDYVTISGLTWNERHTLTVEAMDPGALLSSSKSVDVLIWDPTDNLALGKTVVAGYEPSNSGEHSDKLTDGTNDAWTTYNDRPASEEWFYVDLGAYYQLSSIELVWGEVYSTDYVLQVRQSAPADASEAADDNKWYTAAEVTDASGDATKNTEVDIAARYVRFHSLARSGGFLRLREIRVYGTNFAEADTHVPVITTATVGYNDDGKAYLTLTATDDEDGTTNRFYFYNPFTDTYSIEQTNGANQIVIDGLTACEEYTFTAQAMDQSAQLSLVSNIAVKVPIISTVNLAQGKTATAGTTQGGFVAANAVDGNNGTMWSGNYDRQDGVNQWIKVDLGAAYDLDSIKILWGGNSGTWPQDYELQVSNDGTTFAPFAHYPSASANQANKYTISDVSARYVRVWANKAGNTYGMEICELAVHGDCYTDSELPVMLFAEQKGDAYVTSADIYVGAIHKSIASSDLLYHVVYTDNTNDAYSGSRTITAAEVTNGVFTLDELQSGHSYTVNIYAAKTSDVAGNRSTNHKTVAFSTKAVGDYSNYYMAHSANGWLAVNGGEWTDAMNTWRFVITATPGIYKLTYTPLANATWTYILYDRAHSTRTSTNDHSVSVTTGGRDFVMTMRGLDEFVSNYHTLYIAGDAVGTADDAQTYALTWEDATTATWEGYVTPDETFVLNYADPRAGNASYICADLLTFTYSGTARYAKLTFDLDTWTCSWDASRVDTYIFDNNGGDGNWSTAANWMNNAVPTIEKDVILQAPVTVDITSARAKSVVIDQSGSNDGQLIISAGKELVIAGTLRKTTDGETLIATGENDVFIGSSSTGNGALVIGSHDGTNKATVQFYTLTRGAKDDNTSVAQYIGTPFNDESNILYSWYNSWVYGITYASGSIDWERINEGEGMNPFEGYCVYSYDGVGHVYEMQGTLNASTTHTCSGLYWQSGVGTANANNENLLANSWTAPININAFLSTDFVNTDATIYIFNNCSPSTYAGLGNYTTYTPGSAEADDVIPAMQSFSVFTEAASGSVKLDYERLVYNPAIAGTAPIVPNRAPGRNGTADITDKMHLYVSDSRGYGDMVYMLENESFEDGFENGWDGRKMYGESAAPQLYALTPDGNMTINCVPTMEGTVLGFRRGDNESLYTFSFEYDEQNTWYLNDLREQCSTVISTESTYTFMASDNDEARFVISRTPIRYMPTAVENGEAAATTVRKLLIDGTLYIIRSGRMYDATGAVVR